MEIEIRARAPEDIRSRLDKLGAKETGSTHEHDEYFRFAGDTHRQMVIRIREKGPETLLTFKGSSCVPEDIAWQEWENRISDGDGLKRLMLSNGIVPVVTIDKHRISYKLEDFAINVDTVESLGTFIEIELQSDDIVTARARIAKLLTAQLHIPAEQYITRGYVPMMLDRQ